MIVLVLRFADGDEVEVTVRERGGGKLLGRWDGAEGGGADAEVGGRCVNEDDGQPWLGESAVAKPEGYLATSEGDFLAWLLRNQFYPAGVVVVCLELETLDVFRTLEWCKRVVVFDGKHVSRLGFRRRQW